MTDVPNRYVIRHPDPGPDGKPRYAEGGFRWGTVGKTWTWKNLKLHLAHVRSVEQWHNKYRKGELKKYPPGCVVIRLVESDDPLSLQEVIDGKKDPAIG